MLAATLFAALSLAVPYLPQTEALCGGAATAMVFRYWGDSHADVQQFSPLVDTRAGGIADDVLVRAIEERGWRTFRFAGSIDRLNDQIERGRPVVILVAEGGNRHHYLLVTGIDAVAVIVHDPTWGPSRRIAFDDLIDVWKPTGFWSLVVLPGPDARARTGPTAHLSRAAPSVGATTVESHSGSRCDRQLNEAIADGGGRPLAEAYDLLDGVHRQCPAEAAPLREMAGVRFVEGKWKEARDLAERAAVRDPNDRYAWEVLGSSRFVQEDFGGALRAWNRTGKPQVNLVHISGLERTRFQTIATTLGLWPNMQLTERAFRRADRRLHELPGYSRARLELRPEADGFVTINAAVVESSGLPETIGAWTGSAVAAAVDREVRFAVPGTTGQGEVWTAGWRWWSGRPRVSFGFAAPKLGRVGGVWRVDASWESEQYRPAPSESRAHGALSLSDWLTGDLRYSVTTGIDRWDGTSFSGRTVFVGGSLERRWQDDRWSLAANGTAWVAAAHGGAFHSTAVHGAFRSSRGADGWIYLAGAGVRRASDATPLGLWPRAGDGRDDSMLLRAHPLLRNGVVDVTGESVIGRTLVYGHGEVQRWMTSAGPARIGAALFADLGRASRAQAPWRSGGSRASTTHLDVGAGLRLRAPALAGTLRVDVARGLRDGAQALTVGWQF